MDAGTGWIVAGLALCGAELLHPGVFLLWIGLAATAAGGATLALGLAPTGQVAGFAALLGIALWVSAGRLRGRRGRASPDVNAPGADIVGRTCRALAFAGAEGRVSFRDGSWPARLDGGPPPAPGASLRIVRLDGTTLIVVLA